MKSIHSMSNVNIVLSIEEAKIIHSCMFVSALSLDEWEYDIKIGTTKENVIKIMDKLREIIESAGLWGTPLPKN